MKTISIEKALKGRTKGELCRLIDGISVWRLTTAMRSPRDYRIELDDDGNPAYLVEKREPWKRVYSNPRTEK